MMEKAELLGSLNGLVAKYEQHRNYIGKAKSQQGKFSGAVIEKVILDHEIKSSEVADQVIPLLPTLDSLVSALEGEKASISELKSGVDEQIQELELRAAIGEMTDKEFEKEVKGLRSKVAGDNLRIGKIETDLAELCAARDAWVKLAEPAGHYTAPVVAPAQVAVEEISDELIGEHSAHTDIKEDVSSVFAQAESHVAQVRVGGNAEDEIAIEAGDVAEDAADGPSADVQFGFEDAGGDVEIVAGEIAGEVEIDLGGDAAVSVVASEDGAKGEGDGAARRALLLYQEGTAEEQIYPFTADQLTIGRGRENDIQIKNDSKVSRYHCKLFRRGNNFYIEDIKSSNGTLVNGELITDRRLFGGEEIIVGETFFRFRIME